MGGSVWILDGDEDNRVVAAAGLGRAGMATLQFSSADAFLSCARKGEHDLPPAIVIGARTARDRERAIRDAVYARLIVLTTWPGQLAAWLSVGASRFLLKPYSIESLLEHVDPDGFFLRTRAA